MIQNQKQESSRVGNLEWCKCGECNIEKREIDCLFCQEVDALSGKFDRENMSCVIISIEFETFCINKLVLENESRERSHGKNMV